MIRCVPPFPPLSIQVVSDPAEIERLRPQLDAFDRNSRSLQEKIAELRKHQGMFCCVAECELFFADTPEGVRALADAKHPGALGTIVQYIIPHKGPRIYVVGR